VLFEVEVFVEMLLEVKVDVLFEVDVEVLIDVDMSIEVDCYKVLMVKQFDDMLSRARTMEKTPMRLELMKLLNGLLVGVRSSMTFLHKSHTKDMLDVWLNVRQYNFPYMDPGIIDLEGLSVVSRSVNLFTNCSNIYSIPTTTKVKVRYRNEYLALVQLSQ
jgi:hypothetical protein